MIKPSAEGKYFWPAACASGLYVRWTWLDQFVTLGGPGTWWTRYLVDLIPSGPIVNIGQPGVQRIAFKVYTYQVSQGIEPRHHHEKTSDQGELENGRRRFFLEVAVTTAP